MDTRDLLLAAARRRFERDGLAGLSLRAVGRDAGLSAMAIYRHFADKDALLDALMDDGFVAWEARARAIDEADPVAWLRRLFEAFRDFALSDPHRFDAAFLIKARKARRYPDDMASGRSAVVGMMIERIARAQADHRMSREAPLQIALTLAALAQGLVSMQRAGRFAGEDDFNASYRSVVERVLAGFLTDARGAPVAHQGRETP
jgi:AcrR family transcriptional regulator